MFVLVRDPVDRQRIAELAPHAAHVAKAPVAIAVVMNGVAPQWDDYDEARVAERILIAATALGLGGGIGLVNGDERTEVGELLGDPTPVIPPDDDLARSPDRGRAQPAYRAGNGKATPRPFVRERPSMGPGQS